MGSLVQGQQADSLPKLIHGIHKPNLVSAHPLGLLLYRINHDFSVAPVTKASIQIDLGSANVWLPEVKGYLPFDPQAVNHLSQFVWHQRDSVFQGMPRNYDSIVFSADGVIKIVQLKVKFRINNKLQIDLGLRSFLLTTGADPFTVLTRDVVIENFHQYIAGGTDPFARKQYGYNHAEIYYRAPTGQAIQIRNGNFVIAGINANLIYYPEISFLSKHQMQMNTAFHVGLNTTEYNRGIDLGWSMALLKQINLSKVKTLNIASAASCMAQRCIDLGSTSSFIHSKYLPAFEAVMSYRKALTKHRFWEMGLDFYCIGPYNPSEEFNGITPVGNRLSTHWHYALTHLYRTSQNWSLTFTYGSSWKWMCYINEDLKVNNAPDIQTGIGVELPLHKCKTN